MTKVSTIGLDVAKHVFQVHGVDAAGAVVVQRRLRRSEMVKYFSRLEPVVVGIEACSTSHYWARELRALGHEVRLIPAQYVKAYVKRQKNDAADAAAICEAVDRPSMRFVPVKTTEQQAALMLHRTRDLLVRQRTMLINSVRAQLAEFGVIEARGPGNVWPLAALIESGDPRVPELARRALLPLTAQLQTIGTQIDTLDDEILAWHQASEASRRLATIPGVGPRIASAIAASVPDASIFTTGRQFAAWLGLVPRQRSSGGRPRLGRISKQGDANLRRLLVIGAQSVLRWARPGKASAWIIALKSRRPRKVAAVALANKMARIAWALMARGERYRPLRIATAAA
ncbi:MAG TPA: IS110 family transposase [Xanthobacteraceae bacterium]